jgi:hypothetical protein
MIRLYPGTLRGPGIVSAVVVALCTTPVDGRSQTPTDSLRAEVGRLAAQVDSLTREVDRLTAADPPDRPNDALARLRAAARAAAGDPPPEAPADPEFVGLQRSLQALNPEISVNADVFGHVNQDDVRQDNFFAREFEVSLVSNLDPYSRAKIFLSRHFEGGEFAPFPEEEEHHDEGFTIEEGYVEWVGLPGGLSLKLGKFQQQLGQLNRWHSHALPFQTRSLPHLAFVGEEALAQTGASLHWLLPVGGDAGTYEATVEVTRSENEALFGESGRPSVLGHLNAFWILSSSMDLDLGLTWVNGSFEDETTLIDRKLLGAEMALTWRPPARARYRGVTWRGGVMVLDGLAPESSAVTADRALGVWGAIETRIAESWLVGARADRTESPVDPDETAWLVSPTLTWWQSEYVRLRLEYDLLGRSASATTEGRVLLQVSFAMGPHKHESY